MQKLYANQLGQHLAGQLAPCYLLFGEEPLQKLEAIDAIRAAAKQQGYLERISLAADAQFDWNELSNELQAMSLFAERRLLELELTQAKPAAGVNDQLKQLANQLHQDIVLVIHGSRSHSEVSKLAWFKQLQTQAVQVPIYPLDERQQRQWLQQRAQQLKVQLTSDALQLLQQHCAGNLLAARQELEKLALSNLPQPLDANALSSFLADHSSFTVFQLVDAILQGQTDEALRWYGLAFDKSEGPATRLQWGAGYLGALVDLAPQDAPRIEQVARTLFTEAGQDRAAFHERSARSLQRVGSKLDAWNQGPQQAAVLQRLHDGPQGLAAVCARLAPADPQRATCDGIAKGLLKKAAAG